MQRKKPPVDSISVMVIYSYDREGNIKYDYEEMCEHFSFQLSLLNRERIEIEVTNTEEPFPDDEDEEETDFFDDDKNK